MKPGVESRRQADSSLRYLVKVLLLRTPGRGVTGSWGVEVWLFMEDHRPEMVEACGALRAQWKQRDEHPTSKTHRGVFSIS